MKDQKGITLIELLVALVISLVLMVGVIQLFIGNKRSYQLTEEIARMQESARFAANILAKDIRMAGYTGCTTRDKSSVVINNTLDGPGAAYTPDNGIEGWEADSTGFGSYTIVQNGSVSDASVSGWSTTGGLTLNSGTMSVSNSDIIRLWGIDGDPVLVNSISPGVAQTVVDVTQNADFVDGDILMMTDCSVADIFQACNVQAISGGINLVASAGCTPGNLVTKALLNQAGAHVARLVGKLYFVGKRDDDSSNPPALFRRVVKQNATAGTAEELVEGVEALQILYGEDTDTADPDGVANRYVDAGSVSDWGNVVSVRIELLMQSSRTNLVDGSQTFKFNGATVTASDGRLRYPFMTTVTLRNRTQ